MEMPVDKVIAAVNALDLKVLSLENVELLQRMVPTEQEVNIVIIKFICTVFKNVFIRKGSVFCFIFLNIFCNYR